LSIDEIQVLDLKTSYSDISIDRAKYVRLRSSFDDVEIDQIETLKADANYSDVEIGYLAKKLDIECNFGGITVDRIDIGFTNVRIDSDYAGVELNFDNGASFDAEVYVKYGDFHSKYRSEMDREKLSHSSYRYTGKIGGPSKSRVSIKASFASVEIR